MKIEQLLVLENDCDKLIILLNDCVESGASIGFIAPLEAGEAESYWRGVASDIAEGYHGLWVVRDGEFIVGAVQLRFCAKKNGRHRAEVEKLMVHTAFRQRGIARQLMMEIEQQEKAYQCTLLVLDTRSDDTASLLYRNAGYQEAGRIPQYAKSSAGDLDGTTFFYKII
ncbi:GNAT family N-acetyltransferase [Cobetia sp. L2A1]|uniref:GNAT family N-acetyltransferase n=1 Tax=Cobetia sp. L2A1 TaxID=2686360 RepID=UPI00131B59AE|nr:GNAT family N-acetyltransferase [Cobetia sp. L2A1]